MCQYVIQSSLKYLLYVRCDMIKKNKQSELTFLMFKDFLSEVSFIELNTVQNHHIILTSD